MKIIGFFLGFLIGLITAMVGAYSYLELFTEFNLFKDYKTLIDLGMFSAVLKIGAVLNIGVFFILLKFDKDYVAKGIILTLLSLIILAFFI